MLTLDVFNSQQQVPVAPKPNDATNQPPTTTNQAQSKAPWRTATEISSQELLVDFREN